MAKEVNKYEEANKEFFRNLFAKTGINPNDRYPTEADLKDSPQAVQARGEGVIEYLDYPTEEKISKKCTGCGDVFVTNYRRVSFCGMHCIEKHLKAKYKLAWFPHGNIKKEKWEIVGEPLKVPMRALIAMKTLIRDVETRLGYSIPVSSGEQANLPDQLTPEMLQRMIQNSPELFEDSEQPQIQALEQRSSHNPESTVPSERSETDLEDWLFE